MRAEEYTLGIVSLGIRSHIYRRTWLLSLLTERMRRSLRLEWDAPEVTVQTPHGNIYFYGMDKLNKFTF